MSIHYRALLLCAAILLITCESTSTSTSRSSGTSSTVVGSIAQTHIRPRLAILPFTGGTDEDAETIAEFFSFQKEIESNFIPVPRTTAIENLMREHQFQRAGLTDADTIAQLGKQLNADLVLAGHITQLGTEKLLVITIVHVERLQQIAGAYKAYNQIEEVIEYLPAMASQMATASRQNTSNLPRLAVLPFNTLTSGVDETDAEVLAQILAIEIVNSGKYAVFPRTSSIERVMAEHNIQRSGMTDPESLKLIGAAVNADYVLSANMRGLGVNRFFSASVLHIESGGQEAGRQRQYRTIVDGLLLMTELAQELTTNIMTYIEGGIFLMGSPSSEVGRDSDETQRQVTVSGFHIGRYPVTQREYQLVMGSNPSHFKGDNLPVERVSWFNAISYCNRLSEREGLTPAYNINGTNVIWNRNANGYRLATEAEWEYACRAGTTTLFSFGDSITTSDANFGGNVGQTTPVGTYPANEWGLYDMHGNVWEWCWDWYTSNTSGSNNPTGPSTGADRVIRGGGWGDSAASVRSAYRSYNTPLSHYSSINLGFRLVRP